MSDQYAPQLLITVCNLQVMGQSLYSIHWNLKGSASFLSIHKWTDDQHETVLKLLDTLAERLRAYGVRIPTSLKDIYSIKTIEEVCLFNSEQTDYQCLLALLNSTQQALDQVKMVMITLCDVDLGTQDILISIEQFLLKQIWFINSMGVWVEVPNVE